MHMCGVKYATERPRESFLKDLEAGTENFQRFLVHADGTTSLKFQVLGILPELFKSTKVRISKERVVRFSFQYEAQISTEKKVLGIGLKLMNNGLYIPQTILNLRVEKSVPVGEAVQMIVRRNRISLNYEIMAVARHYVPPKDLSGYFK